MFSGYRFVRHAAAQGIPVAIVNRGRTRGDDLATVKVDGGCSELLALLATELAGAPVALRVCVLDLADSFKGDASACDFGEDGFGGRCPHVRPWVVIV